MPTLYNLDDDRFRRIYNGTIFSIFSLCVFAIFASLIAAVHKSAATYDSFNFKIAGSFFFCLVLIPKIIAEADTDGKCLVLSGLESEESEGNPMIQVCTIWTNSNIFSFVACLGAFLYWMGGWIDATNSVLLDSLNLVNISITTYAFFHAIMIVVDFVKEINIVSDRLRRVRIFGSALCLVTFFLFCGFIGLIASDFKFFKDTVGFANETGTTLTYFILGSAAHKNSDVMNLLKTGSGVMLVGTCLVSVSLFIFLLSFVYLFPVIEYRRKEFDLGISIFVGLGGLLMFISFCVLAASFTKAGDLYEPLEVKTGMGSAAFYFSLWGIFFLVQSLTTCYELVYIYVPNTRDANGTNSRTPEGEPKDDTEVLALRESEPAHVITAVVEPEDSDEHGLSTAAVAVTVQPQERKESELSSPVRPLAPLAANSTGHKSRSSLVDIPVADADELARTAGDNKNSNSAVEVETVR